MAAIEVEGLRKSYRQRRRPSTALDGLDLSVPEGGVFGFLGPNGSGKTTTIRCLLGLTRPTAGTISVLGEPVPSGLASTMKRIGAIVEAPALFPTMTGRDNLALLAAIDRIGPRRTDAVLEQVGLADRADDLVSKYSLGMRQRLALAAAILKDPALVILDEPGNGLDPAGIRQVRDHLRLLGAEGRTVFVSSHLLAEIEQTCDSVAILRRGRCVAQGRVADIVARASTSAAMLVRVAEMDTAERVLVRSGFAVERRRDLLRVDVCPAEAARITEALGTERLWITELRPEAQTLEDLFLELTEEPKARDDSSDHGTVGVAP